MSGIIESPYLELRGTVPRSQLSPFAEVLSSPFAGSDATDTPAASGFGMLAKIVRLNHLASNELYSLLGIRVRRADDLSAIMTFSEARQIAVARALRLPDVPAEWNLSTWFPFKASSSLLATGWTLRYCPECLLEGYHTLLHQLPWVHRCAWHDLALRNGCQHCGLPVAVKADWMPGENMQCACRRSPLETDRILHAQAPEGAKQFTDEYLQWAAEVRARTTLVVPELAGDPRPALTALIELPRSWRLRVGPAVESRADEHMRSPKHMRGVHVRTLKPAKRAPMPVRDDLVGLEVVQRDRPGFLSTPKRLEPMMSAVAVELATRLPVRTLTDREMSLFLEGAGIEAPTSFAPASRAFSGEVSLLPPTYIGGRQFLNLLCVHPSAYRLVGGLVDEALDGRSLFDFHAQATHQEFDLLMRACGQVLARGYAEGLRSTLAVHVPELYAQPRLAPRLRQPWALLDRTNGSLSKIRVAWVPLPRATHSEAALLKAEDEANQRRQQYGRRRDGGRRKSGHARLRGPDK
ncbi:hypothetical protein CMZ82_09630 [Lysobacteraceae bacterium NML93-0792]|nr:hypothetical protein CMZ82_09630 [Xanthomonadaceae bacterium NML93-0792]PBS15954.1 hypothetical protein CMZ81_08450 [Xanthomonadaceae bacterium NML93-0793]PBS18865.1 hypothetical protein CMZ80_09145 [Xanthomonadaceae bacterium NML93-0831]